MQELSAESVQYTGIKVLVSFPEGYMKLLFSGLFAFLALGSFTAVSAKQPQEIKVQINHESAARGGVKIKFIDMIEDSHCPTDTQCVWAGNAKISVQLSKNGKK